MTTYANVEPKTAAMYGHRTKFAPVAAGVTLALAALCVTPAVLAAEKDWVVPRTSDGQPELQGYWTNTTVIPLERPVELGDKAFYTPEEAAAVMKERLAVEETEAGTAADVHYQLTDFALDASQNTVATNLRTSLVVDPPNGRIPAVLPAAAARAKERADYQRAHAFDSAKDRPLGERCMLWGHQVPPIIPVGYNSNVRILQTPGYVVIQTEMLQDPRIVPLTDRPELSANVGQWLGDSHGRWEGDTLVVETTSFSGMTGARGGVPNLRLSRDARVTERFERTGPETITYQFTVEDPSTYERPWSGEYPMTAVEGPFYEYACHEGNYGIANILSGARADEREAAAAKGAAEPAR